MTTVMQRSARLKQSLAESSFDAWINYIPARTRTPRTAWSAITRRAPWWRWRWILRCRGESGRRRLPRRRVCSVLWRHGAFAGPSYRGIEEDEIVAQSRAQTGIGPGPALRVLYARARAISGLFDICCWRWGPAEPKLALYSAAFCLRCRLKTVSAQASRGPGSRQFFYGGRPSRRAFHRAMWLMGRWTSARYAGEADALLARLFAVRCDPDVCVSAARIVKRFGCACAPTAPALRGARSTRTISAAQPRRVSLCV